MKKITAEWIEIAEWDWETANREIAVPVNTNFKAVSFHAQQCGEKYLKAFLQEAGVNPERTHDLQILLSKIVLLEPTFNTLTESCLELTDFAVDHRYPGSTTSAQDAADALYHSGFIRIRVRTFFELAI